MFTVYIVEIYGVMVWESKSLRWYFGSLKIICAVKSWNGGGFRTGYFGNGVISLVS